MNEKNITKIEDFFNRYSKTSISGLPKYAQLREAINAAITDGFWNPGDQLPNEESLASSKNYSLGTVQRALKELAKSGIITRKHGQGSFVLEQSKAMNQPNHLQFIDPDDDNGIINVFPKILGRYPVQSEGPWSKVLQADIRNLMRVDRLFKIGTDFRTYSRFYIDVSKYPFFSAQNIDAIQAGNFKTILRKEYNVEILKYETSLRVETFDYLSDIFNEVPELTGAILEFTGISDKESAIYYQEIFIPPNNKKLILSNN